MMTYHSQSCFKQPVLTCRIYPPSNAACIIGMYTKNDDDDINEDHDYDDNDDAKDDHDYKNQ